MSILTIVDTDILIDVGREVPAAAECLVRIEDHSVPAVSIISQMELLVGCRTRPSNDTRSDFLGDSIY